MGRLGISSAALGFFGGGALVVLSGACTGDDPVFVTGEAGAAETGAAEASGGDAADAAPDTFIPPGETDPRCPRPTLAACGADPTYGTPAFRLDACALGGREQELASWTAVTGHILGPAPRGGGIYCRGGFNARPGVLFDDSRGYVLPSASFLDYSFTFTLVAALTYTQQVGVPGSIIFQRSSPEAASGFPGPQLIANMAYATTFGTTGYTGSPGIGMQLRFGPQPAIDGMPLDEPAPGRKDGIAAATADFQPGPLILVVRHDANDPAILELRINGKLAATTSVPATFGSKGIGEVLRIGHTPDDKNKFVGALGELVFWTTAITSGDLDAIEAAMLAKWGVARAN